MLVRAQRSSSPAGRGDSCLDEEGYRIFGRVVITPKADEATFLGRRGLIFCRNFWGPGNQGDHIDLWNKGHMKTGYPSYIARSEETWFWEIDSTAMVRRHVRRS